MGPPLDDARDLKQPPLRYITVFDFGVTTSPAYNQGQYCIQLARQTSPSRQSTKDANSYTACQAGYMDSPGCAGTAKHIPSRGPSRKQPLQTTSSAGGGLP